MIGTLALGLILALALGMLAQRIKLSPLVAQKREYVKDKIFEDQVTLTLDHFGDNGDYKIVA